MTLYRWATIVAGASIIACGQPAPSSGPALTGAWTLVRLGAERAPPGAGGRPATLVFSDSGRAGGFAGCNRIAGSYERGDTTLRFGPLIMTRMACAEGMDLEARYAAALVEVTSYRVRTDTLELTGDAGVVAVFAR